MKIEKFKNRFPEVIFKIIEGQGIIKLMPIQEKAIKAGIFKGRSLLVCSPTASGKTLIAEFAFLNSIINEKKKAIYIVHLKALASEKYNDFKEKYGNLFRIALSMGDLDSRDEFLTDFDLIITTSEKLDSLMRHKLPWLKHIQTVVIDEIHLLNDPGRGPTLEIIITLLKKILKNVQILGLSATIGNPDELADWLDAKHLSDNWRPVKLKKGVYLDSEIEFFGDKDG